MKRELDLDGILKEWQAPSRADAAWEQQADAIVSKATDAGAPDARKLDALLADPELGREPGEPTTAASHFMSGAGAVVPISGRVAVGETKMADEKDQQGPSSTEAPRKKLSLKEIAERASQSGASRPPPSSVSTPLPGRTSSPSLSTPVPGAGAKSALSTPLPRPATSTPLPGRPSEAGKDDSGMVDLNVVNQSATPEQKEAAEKAQPGQADLLDDAPASQRVATAAAASQPAAAKSAAAAAAAPAKKGSGGAVAGIAIAVIGLAAAFAMVQRDKLFGSAPPAPVAQQDRAAEQAPTAAAAAPTTTAAAEAPAAAGEAPKEEPVAAAEQAKATPGAPVPGGPAAPAAPGAKPGEDKPATPAPVAAATGKPGEKPGDLSSAMEKAVGPVEKGAEEGKAEPASGSKNSNIPEQPPQGSVSAAMAGVMGGAKACVAGADDVSRATVTFSSSGAVSSVSVTGWAASNGAGGCIKSALKGANVGPFSKPSFTVGVTIRP